MSDEVWYYHHAGEQAGPVSWKKLQELAESGGIDPDDLVWKEGTPDWTPARSVKDLYPEGAVPPPAKGPPPVPKVKKPRGPIKVRDFLPHIKVVEALLELLRKTFSEKLLDQVDRWAKIVGNIAYMAAAVFGFLFFVIYAIKASSLPLFFVALAIIPVAALLQYAALLFLDAGKTVIAKSPSELSTPAVLDCFGLVSFVGAIAYLIGGIVLAFSGGGFMAFAAGLGAALVLLYVGSTALNPSAVNVEVGGKTSAGEEAISIVSFLMKLGLLRIIPFVFGIGATVGLIYVFYLYYPMFKDAPMLAAFVQPAYTGVLGIALLPFIGYLLFLVYYLVFDLLRAILVVPGKIESLKEEPSIEGAPTAKTAKVKINKKK
jgi:hypothetical protein